MRKKPLRNRISCRILLIFTLLCAAPAQADDAEAFFQTNVVTAVERMLKAIPARSQYAEMAEITTSTDPLTVKQALSVFAPQWELTVCGTEMNPGMRSEALGRKNVLVTRPFDTETPCLLTSTPAIPVDKKTVLKLTVGHHPQGDWNLLVKDDHQLLYQTMVGPDTARDGWLDVSVDLTEYAGHVILLQLLNQATGSYCQAGYWASIAIESK